MEFKRELKCAPGLGIRTVPYEETIERCRRTMEHMEIDPPIDATELDTIGIPVYIVIRRDKGFEGQTHNGKGPNPEQALASCLMEAIERYSCPQHDNDEPYIIDTYGNACRIMPAVDPVDFILPPVTRDISHDRPIQWTVAYDIVSRKDILVPQECVYAPVKKGDWLQIAAWNTNGLASGNTLEEAVLHGLYELIERDATSIATYRKEAKREILLRNGDSVPAKLMAMVRKAGFDIRLKDITQDNGVYTIAAALDDRKGSELSLSLGYGTHLNPEVAAVRAITEVAQGRVTEVFRQKQTGRPQRHNTLSYEELKRRYPVWFAPEEETICLEDLPDLSTPYVLDDIEIVVKRLCSCGLNRVLVKDLTRGDLGIPVVRVIVPGLEVYEVDNTRRGPRLAKRTAARSVYGHAPPSGT